MALWSKRERTPVGTVEIAFVDSSHARVNRTALGAGRQEQSYHAVLHFLMSYGRVLFFLAWRDEAYELVGWMEEAVRLLAEAEDGAPVTISRGWSIAPNGDDEPRSVWSSTLSTVGDARYRCALEIPKDPEDADAQAFVLLHLQSLVDELPALERAYLALGIAGMHEYYEHQIIWANSKSLHPAPEYGMDHARRVLEGPAAAKSRRRLG